MSHLLAAIAAFILFSMAEERLPDFVSDLLWGSAYLFGALWFACYAFGLDFPPTPYF